MFFLNIILSIFWFFFKKYNHIYPFFTISLRRLFPRGYEEDLLLTGNWLIPKLYKLLKSLMKSIIAEEFQKLVIKTKWRFLLLFYLCFFGIFVLNNCILVYLYDIFFIVLNNVINITPTELKMLTNNTSCVFIKFLDFLKFYFIFFSIYYLLFIVVLLVGHVIKNINHIFNDYVRDIESTNSLICYLLIIFFSLCVFFFNIDVLILKIVVFLNNNIIVSNTISILFVFNIIQWYFLWILYNKYKIMLLKKWLFYFFAGCFFLAIFYYISIYIYFIFL